MQTWIQHKLISPGQRRQPKNIGRREYICAANQLEYAHNKETSIMTRLAAA